VIRSRTIKVGVINAQAEIAAHRALVIKAAAARDRVIMDGVIKVGTRIGVIKDRVVIGRRMVIGNRGIRRA
jgi:hypothetical protein